MQIQCKHKKIKLARGKPKEREREQVTNDVTKRVRPVKISAR